MHPIHKFIPFLLLAACAKTPGTVPSFATRDSAGVKLVVSGVALWDNAPGWTVDSVPFLSIGAEDGADPYLLSSVAGALRRDDGSIVIADGAAGELRVFDSAGKFVMTKGRKGPGPAEFGWISRIARCGADEIWINTRSRVSAWSVQLDYRRELKVADMVMWPLICFGGTGLVVKRDIGSDMDQHAANIITVDSLHLMTVDSLGSSRRDLMDIPLQNRIILKTDQGGIGAIHPFGTSTLLGQRDTSLIIGFAKHLEVNSYTRDGRLIGIARGPTQHLELTSDILGRYADANLKGMDGQIRDLLAGVGNPMPEDIPAYVELVVDREGNIWVKRFQIPGYPDTRWGVFRRDGRFLGHLELPAGITVNEIGSDYLLGTVRDSDGVQQVQEFRIRK